MNKILHGDCIEQLQTLPSGIIDTCVTSPPYFGLRDYGHAGQIGLEETPEQFVQKMVDVFREVRRVLKDDGTLWLNLGDSYAGNNSQASNNGRAGFGNPREKVVSRLSDGLKPKDLIGIPWRVAFALQADGWYLRQDIIWHKPNPMPESVTDRCTKAHEYIFLLSKNARYYYDNESVKEESTEESGWSKQRKKGINTWKYNDTEERMKATNGNNNGTFGTLGKRNKRSVWTVTTEPFKDAHFAVFPPNLIKPCILAGSQKGGIVLDPFFGSGTTGLVALRAGRKYIGCELNEKYIQIAKRRLHEYQTQHEMF